jgi:hypothetical protein
MPSARWQAYQWGRSEFGSMGFPTVFEKTRLDLPKEPNHLREQLHGPTSCIGLRVAVLPQVSRAPNVETTAIQVDVSPLESGSLRGSKSGPEQHVQERMVGGMRAMARPLDHAPGVPVRVACTDPC